MDAKTNEFYFLRAHVWPSMKSSLLHNVLIVLSVASGAVMHASCEPCKVSALGRCSHVVTVLFTLLDHVEKNGPTISTPVTSKECVWNKGKKRDKNPQRLSDVKYPSKRKLGTVDVIDFDPRPKSRRHVEARHINNLIKDLQVISQNTKDLSMWETQLEIRYEDYEVADIDVSQLMDRTLIIENNITPSVLKQLEGTEQQSASEKWFKERWLRLTASKCLTSCRIGKLIVEGKANASVRAFKFISTNIWGIDREPFQSYWMKYGLESEPNAILKFEEQTRNVVSTGCGSIPSTHFWPALQMVLLMSLDYLR